MNPPEPTSPCAATETPASLRAKKKLKARGVWISFSGRILAQFIGSASSVVLGLFVLRHHQAADTAKAAGPVAAPATVVRTVVHSTGAPTVHVRRLRDVSSDATAAHGFADALSDAITADLVHASGLRVTSPPAGARRTATTTADRDGFADFVVDGSVLVAGGRVRVTISLIDGVTSQHVWAESFHRSVRDPIGVQDTLAADIGAQVRALVGKSDTAPATVPSVVTAGPVGVALGYGGEDAAPAGAEPASLR